MFQKSGSLRKQLDFFVKGFFDRAQVIAWGYRKSLIYLWEVENNSKVRGALLMLEKEN